MFFHIPETETHSVEGRKVARPGDRHQPHTVIMRLARPHDPYVIQEIERIGGPIQDLEFVSRVYAEKGADGRDNPVFQKGEYKKMAAVGVPIYIDHCYPIKQKIPRGMHANPDLYNMPTKGSVPIGHIIGSYPNIVDGELFVRGRFDVSGMNPMEENEFREMVATRLKEMSIAYGIDKNPERLKQYPPNIFHGDTMKRYDGKSHARLFEISVTENGDIGDSNMLLVKCRRGGVNKTIKHINESENMDTTETTTNIEPAEKSSTSSGTGVSSTPSLSSTNISNVENRTSEQKPHIQSASTGTRPSNIPDQQVRSPISDKLLDEKSARPQQQQSQPPQQQQSQPSHQQPQSQPSQQQQSQPSQQQQSQPSHQQQQQSSQQKSSFSEDQFQDLMTKVHTLEQKLREQEMSGEAEKISSSYGVDKQTALRLLMNPTPEDVKNLMKTMSATKATPQTSETKIDEKNVSSRDGRQEYKDANLQEISRDRQLQRKEIPHEQNNPGARMNEKDNLETLRRAAGSSILSKRERPDGDNTEINQPTKIPRLGDRMQNDVSSGKQNTISNVPMSNLVEKLRDLADDPRFSNSIYSRPEFLRQLLEIKET